MGEPGVGGMSTPSAKERAMNSNISRAAVGAVVVVVAVVLLIVLKGGSSDTSATTKGVTTIVIKNGEPVGGIAQLTYNKGEEVRFKVDSDVSDEVHMHGYDIMKDVKAGGSVSFDFPATIEGVFEAELEGRKEQILELTVNP
jgi:FlaG/FlaF family flagellin (archaellin)